MIAANIPVLCILLAFMGMSSFAQTKAEPSVVFVGTYDSFDVIEAGKLKELRVYGYSLELWNDGERLEGLWFHAGGQSENFPRARIANVTLDKNNGRLTFTVPWCGDETFAFAGVFRENEVSGSLTFASAKQRRTQPILLRRDANDSRDPRPLSRWKLMMNSSLRYKPHC